MAEKPFRHISQLTSESYEAVGVVRQCTFLCFGAAALERRLRGGIRIYSVEYFQNPALAGFSNLPKS